MSRTAFPGAHLLVEGPSDSRFWRGRIERRKSTIVICGGKDAACKSIAALDNSGMRGAVAIVDDDLDSVLGAAHASPNLVVTDARDLEAMLLESDALERVMAELVPPSELESFECGLGTSFRDGLVQRCLSFARLRYVARERQLYDVDFNRLKPWKFVDAASWTLDREALLEAFCASATISTADLNAFLNLMPSAAPWKLICGHDAMTLWYIALTGVFRIKKLPFEALSSALRLAYSHTALSGTALFRALKAWSEANAHEFLVL